MCEYMRKAESVVKDMREGRFLFVGILTIKIRVKNSVVLTFKMCHFSHRTFFFFFKP